MCVCQILIKDDTEKALVKQRNKLILFTDLANAAKKDYFDHIKANGLHNERENTLGRVVAAAIQLLNNTRNIIETLEFILETCNLELPEQPTEVH